MASAPTKHGRQWRVRWRHRTEGMQTFSHIDKHVAQRFRDWLDAEVQDERDLLETDERITVGAYLAGSNGLATLSSLARELIKERVNDIKKPLRPTSVAGYEDRIKRFGPLGGLPLEMIDRDMVLKHVRGMQTTPRQSTGRPFAPNTVRETVTFMRQIGAWAVRTERAEYDPFKDVPLPNGTAIEETKFLTMDEYLELRSYATSQTFKDMMDLIALETGARIGEVLALRVDDLSREDGYDRVRIDETLNSQNKYTTPKNGKPRGLDISTDGAATLWAYAEGRPDEAALFENFGGDGPVTYQQFHRLWDRMVVRAAKDGVTFPKGIPTPHWLRHAYAGWFLAAQDEDGRYVGDIYDLQARLGHSSIRITIDRYGHKTPEARARAFSATTSVRRFAFGGAAQGRPVRNRRGSHLGVAG